MNKLKTIWGEATEWLNVCRKTLLWLYKAPAGLHILQTLSPYRILLVLFHNYYKPKTSTRFDNIQHKICLMPQNFIRDSILSCLLFYPGTLSLVMNISPLCGFKRARIDSETKRCSDSKNWQKVYRVPRS